MDLDLSTVMDILFPAGTLLLALLLILAAVLHINNLNRVYKLMAALRHEGEGSKNESKDHSKGGYKALLYQEMTIPQGINFTALALAAWIMLFVALATFTCWFQQYFLSVTWIYLIWPPLQWDSSSSAFLSHALLQG